MTLIYAKWLPVVVTLLLVFSFFLYRKEKKFFAWITLYWFYQRSLASKLSSFFFLLSVVLFSFALLDVRGPEVRLQMEIPEQKTILLIDASASMLTEDVRPNRFERGIFLARHFARTAIGHQISVIIFSDISKRVVSFTNDIDLLDARLTGLEKMDIASGGSSITGALHEAVKYFLEDSGKGPLTGNLVIITDGEENVASLKMDIPEGVALAVIGIGTAQGGYIPMRSKDGTFRGYRRYNGENVVSKLNENWFKSFAENHRFYKYWVAQSYNVPTEEVLDFFSKVYNRRMSDGEVRFRPVWGLPIIALAFASLLLSSLFGIRKTFIKQSSLVFLLCFGLSFLNSPSIAQDKKEPEPSQESMELLNKMQKGELQGERKLKLAESLYKDGLIDQSLMLYKEIFTNLKRVQYRESWKNYAFLLLSSGDLDSAGKELSELFQTTQDENELEDLRTNVILILQKEGEQNSSGEGESEESSKEDSGENESKQNESEGDNKDQSKEEGEGSEGSDSPDEETEEEGDRSDEEIEKNDEKEEDGSEQEKDEPKEPQTWDAKVQDIKQQLRTKDQLPAILKQIMDADREVQQQELDTRTTDPAAGNEKDW